MHLLKTVSLIVIVGLCSYALLLYVSPLPTASDAQETVPKIQPEASSSAQTRLFFNPSILTLNSSQIKEIPIIIQTGENEVNEAQIEIKYNPAILKVLNIRPADFFIDPVVQLQEVDEPRGRINLVIGIDRGKTNIKGTGTLAIVSLIYLPTASGSGKTQLQFMPKTNVKGSVQRVSLLQSTENLIIDNALK